MDYQFKILKRSTGYEGFFRLERYELSHRLFAGDWSRPIYRELLRKGHAAAALLYDPDGDCVVMIEQFRIGALEREDGPWLLELVAGFIEPGESAEEVVRREAKEEAGCDVLELIPIRRYWLSPGGETETISLFCGRVKAPPDGEIHGLDEEDEDIRVHVMRVDEALDRLNAGAVDSATPIIALQWLQLNHAALRRRFA